MFLQRGVFSPLSSLTHERPPKASEKRPENQHVNLQLPCLRLAGPRQCIALAEKQGKTRNKHISEDDLKRRRNRISTSIREKDNRQHRYVLSRKDKSLLIRVVGKGCAIDRKTEYVGGAIFHTFGLFTPSL